MPHFSPFFLARERARDRAAGTAGKSPQREMPRPYQHMNIDEINRVSGILLGQATSPHTVDLIYAQVAMEMMYREWEATEHEHRETIAGLAGMHRAALAHRDEEIGALKAELKVVRERLAVEQEKMGVVHTTLLERFDRLDRKNDRLRAQIALHIITCGAEVAESQPKVEERETKE